MLTNPFYAGSILWGGQLYPGKHQPVVSYEEFDRVQVLLGRPSQPRPKRNTLAYTGMIRCAACNHMITAEHKRNRYGTHYLYYHCTKSSRPKCTQPSIEVKLLEAQISEFLTSITLPDAIHQWTLSKLGASASDRQRDREAVRKSLQHSIQDTNSQISTLTDLRIRGLIADTEFIERRTVLQSSLSRLQQSLQTADSKNSIEPEQLLLLFSNRAISWFRNGDDEARRMLLATVSSNLFLKDKKLSIQAKKPFQKVAKFACLTRQLVDLESNQD